MKPLVLALTLAALPASAAAQPAGGTPQVVTVRLSNFDFDPSQIVLEHGRDYVLHLVSMVGGGHNFDAPQFFAAARVAPEDRAKLSHGAVEVHGREAVDIHLTAPAAGSYPLHCSHFGHALLGMRGRITVR